MKTYGIAAAALLAAASPAAATTIDFETAPSGTTGFTIAGVTFTAGGQTISATTTPNNTLGLLAEGSPRSPITATFASLNSGAISVDLGDFASDADGLFLELYSASNVLLNSATLLTTDTDSTMHTLTTSASGVSYAIFGARAPSVNGSSVYADNFTFGTSTAVPEPATWAMMIAGFAFAGGALRRRPARYAAQLTFQG